MTDRPKACPACGATYSGMLGETHYYMCGYSTGRWGLCSRAFDAAVRLRAENYELLSHLRAVLDDVPFNSMSVDAARAFLAAHDAKRETP